MQLEPVVDLQELAEPVQAALTAALDAEPVVDLQELAEPVVDLQELAEPVQAALIAALDAEPVLDLEELAEPVQAALDSLLAAMDAQDAQLEALFTVPPEGTPEGNI